MRVAFLGFFGALVVRCLYVSMRWPRSDFLDHEKLPTDTPYIAAFWHGRQLMLPPLYRASRRVTKVYVLISQHIDGRLIAAATSYFGLRSVAGSSNRGAINAARHMVEKLEEGHAVALAPDGPRGPLYKAKEGAIRIAQLSGRRIYPMTTSASSFWTIRAWDKMLVPKPFSRGVLLIGEPVTVPTEVSDVELAELVQTLEERLNALTAEADGYFNA